MPTEPNPHYISQNATGTSLTQPVDTVDYPHSGLIKALNQMAAGNVVVKTGADFDINQTGSNIVVTAGKILRNGKYIEVSSDGSGADTTIADSTLNSTWAKGYHLLVVADGREGGETADRLYLRPPTANERVPEFKLGDTIVAIIEYSTGTSAGSRLIQYFTTNKESNSVSIAYANSNVYTPTASIIGAAGGTTLTNTVGDLTIQNTDTNDQIIMKLGAANDATVAFEVQDSAAQVQFKVQGDGAVSTEGDLTVGGGDIAFPNTANSTLSVAATTSTTAGKDLTISAGSTSTNGNNIDGGDLILNAGAGDGTGTSIMTFNTKVSGTDAVAERMRIHTSGNVGISTNTPKTQLDVRGPAGSGAVSGGALTLSTAETTVVDGDYLGIINFQAPLEASGTDSILVGASIHAEADDTFATDNNATELVFSTASTTAPIERMRIDQAGFVGIGTAIPDAKLHVIGVVSAAGFKPKFSEVVFGPVPTDEYDVSLTSDHTFWLTSPPAPTTDHKINLPEATAATIGHQFRVIVKSILGGNNIKIYMDGSDVLVDPAQATLTTPYALAAGKVYDIVGVTSTQWMLILLN